MAFNLGSILSDKTVAQAHNSHQVQYIKRTSIIPNEYNNEVYSVNNIELLSYSIEDNGLLEPLIVSKDTSNDSTYILISGHRRKAAIDLLCERNEEMAKKFEVVPAIVRNNDSDIDEILLDGNIFNRDKTDAEKAKELAEKKKKMLERKERGEKVSGKLLELIASEMQISYHQAKKLNAINANASESVKEEFTKGNISTETAYQLSKVDEETQDEIINTATDEKRITAKDVKEHLDASTDENDTVLSPTEETDIEDVKQDNVASNEGMQQIDNIINDNASDESHLHSSLLDKISYWLDFFNIDSGISLTSDDVSQLKEMLHQAYNHIHS